ncbi:MAG: hypothetical protein QXU18_04100 [Thermoplasmatales archaeon]
MPQNQPLGLKHKLSLDQSQFYAIIIILNLAIQVISYLIFHFVRNETFAIAFEVFVGIVGNGIIVYLNSEEAATAAFFIRNFFRTFSALDKAFFVLMITLVNAVVQLISSILPVYVKNGVEVAAIQLFLSVIGTAIVVYLSTEEATASSP